MLHDSGGRSSDFVVIGKLVLNNLHTMKPISEKA